MTRPLTPGTAAHVRLSQLVNWSSTPQPRWRRAARWVPTVVGAAIFLLTQTIETLSGPTRQDPLVDLGAGAADGQDPPSPLGVVHVTGTGAGLPRRYPAPVVVSLYRDQATVSPGTHPIRLQLQHLHIESARRLSPRWKGHKAVDTRWQLHVTGEDADLTFEGTWLMLAQLGTLAGWPEPQ